MTDSPNRVEVIHNDVLPGTPLDFLGGFDSILTISPGENYAFAVNDLDNDGRLDLVLGRCVGTEVWRNETNPVVCQPTVVPISLGTASLSLCGAPLHSNLTAQFVIANGPPDGLAIVLVSATATTAQVLGGQVLQPFQFAVPFTLPTSGSLALAVAGGGGSPSGTTLYVQSLMVPASSGAVTQVSNVLAVTFLD